MLNKKGEESINTKIKQIPELSNFRDIFQIKKGFSSDEKYVIHTNENHKLFLRIFNQEDLGSKKKEYYILEKMRDLNVHCSRPVSINEMENWGYLITTYLEGKDAEDEIPKHTINEQFNIGFEAGKELRKIHQYAAPNNISSWYLRKVKKHNKYMKDYLACGVQIKDDQKIINFIENNIHLMKHRPNLFQHDDFHPANIIVNNKKFAGVIDFNRFDWGDPYHEFLKIGIFNREVSVPYSIGQIRGYFNNEDPDEYFWRLYSLYLAMCVFSTVIWSLKNVPDSLNDMLEKVYLFLDDHDYFNQIKPKWYESWGT